MLAKEVGRPAQRGLYGAAVVGVTGHGRRHQAIGGVALAGGVYAQRGLRAVGRLAHLAQGHGLLQAGAADGQAGTALQGGVDQGVELLVAQRFPPLGWRGSFCGGGIQAQGRGRGLCQRRVAGAGVGAADEQEGCSQGQRRDSEVGRKG
ncbi:hypothetical protein D3C71_1726290 [compost metagenome]